MTSYREDYEEVEREFFWTLPRVLGATFVIILSCFLLAVVTTPLTIAFGWYKGEANLRSFAHVKETYAEGYNDVNSLEALARQACRARVAYGVAKTQGDSLVTSQRYTQLITIENTFDRVRGEYDAYMADHFRGKVIHPSDLPIPYPSLSEVQQVQCNL